MRQTSAPPAERPEARPTAEAVVGLLAEGGLRAERVARCPDAACPLCSATERAA